MTPNSPAGQTAHWQQQVLLALWMGTAVMNAGKLDVGLCADME